MENEIVKKYLPIIEKHIPHIRPERITLLDDGHDHYVLLVDAIHSFRFPRTEAHGEKDQVENAFLPRFAHISPVSVQQMVGHHDDKLGIPYQTYAFIPGVSLSRELAASLTEEELGTIAKDMGKFLSTLHSFPKDEAVAMNMESLISPEDYGAYFKEFLKKKRDALFPLLAKEEQEWIEKSVEEFSNLTKEHPFEMKVTHSDMLPEHILIDPKTHQLTGIIDFSLRIADPANDFKFFDRYGDTFLKAVYDNYLTVDEYFDIRRKYYAGNLPVATLSHSIEGKDSRMIELHLKQLKEYIAAQIEK